MAHASTGDALLISPILRRGATATKAYFPAGLWYSLYDHSVVNATAGGRNVTVTVRVQPHPVDQDMIVIWQAGLHSVLASMSLLSWKSLNSAPQLLTLVPIWLKTDWDMALHAWSPLSNPNALHTEHPAGAPVLVIRGPAPAPGSMWLWR